MTSIQADLKRMIERGVALHGTTHDENGVLVNSEKANKDFLRQLASLAPDPKEQAKIIIAAWDDKTGNLQRQLSSIRVEQVGNFIFAESDFMSMYFESVTLGETEEPVIYNDTENEIRIGAIGEDGTPDQVRVLKPASKYNVGLQFLASQIVKYKTLDLYKGNIAEVAKKTFNIARDLSFKLDRVFFDLMNADLSAGGAFGDFSYENNLADPEKRIFLAHSGIKTVHLPTTNDLDVHVASGGRFNIEVLKAIVNYCALWANVAPGGRFTPSGEIIVPSSDIIQIAEDATPIANTIENRIQEGVNQNGYTQIPYLGMLWKFIASVTIDPGACYPRMSLLPGRAFFKPAFDREFVELNQVENWESRWQRKVYGAHIISQYRPRALRVTYKNP
jgi:hypothetical protein